MYIPINRTTNTLVCRNTHKKGRQEDCCQGDQGSQHHLRGDLGAAATHDGCENLKHHPDEEHEVNIRQRQAQQVEHTVPDRCSCRNTGADFTIGGPQSEGIRTNGELTSVFKLLSQQESGDQREGNHQHGHVG